MRRALPGILLFLASGAPGCDAILGRVIRPVSMETSDAQGQWRLEGVQQVTLQKLGWEVRIVRSRVNATPVVPLLETLSSRWSTQPRTCRS